MTRELFITGGGGYVGRRVLELLDPGHWGRVTVLFRRPPPQIRSGIEALEGDLHDPGGWEEVLNERTTILHLAALTGKGRRSEHLQGNVETTRTLLHAAATAGADRLIFVSSVAAAFERRAGYHYAEAKLAAEQLVRDSGLSHLIVRPTMVFGPDAPVLGALKRLASAPLAPLFGGGQHLCQPVFVDDLARWLEFAAVEAPADGRVLSVGGPDRISLKDLICRLRGKSEGLISVPLGPIIALLRVIESPLMPIMPLTAGQLATFHNDSTADSLTPSEGAALLETPLDEMLR